MKEGMSVQISFAASFVYKATCSVKAEIWQRAGPLHRVQGVKTSGGKSTLPLRSRGSWGGGRIALMLVTSKNAPTNFQ